VTVAGFILSWQDCRQRMLKPRSSANFRQNLVGDVEACWNLGATVAAQLMG
jgi:hypothetical protein